MKYITSIVLALSILMYMHSGVAHAQDTTRPADSEESPAIGCAVAIVVLVVGVIVIYKIIKLCNEKLPPSPPPETNVTSAAYISLTGTYADVGSTQWTAYDVDCVISSIDDVPQVSLVPHVVDQQLTPQSSLSEYLNGTGLDVFTPYGDAYFASNGIPIESWQSTIYYDGSTVRVADGAESAPMYTIRIDESKDLIHWSPVFTVESSFTHQRFTGSCGGERVFIRAVIVR